MRHKFLVTNVSPRILRRLTAAEGYLDLEMPRHALAELDALDDYGPFEAAVHFLRGQALKAEQRFEEAIGALQRAAEMIPAPHNSVAWLSLSECFREQGREALADAIEKFARAVPQVNGTPEFHVTIQIAPIPVDDEVILESDEELADTEALNDEFRNEFDDGFDDGGSAADDLPEKG